MIPKRLAQRTVTVTEDLGTEDASGHKETRVTVHTNAAYVEHRRGASPSIDGSAPADSGLVVLQPTGYGDTWSIKPRDTVTLDDGHTGTVTSATPVRSMRPPRTLHHVEATIG